MQSNRISDIDISLIDNKLVNYEFGYINDIVELHILDSNGISIKHIENHTKYKPSANYGLINSLSQAIDIFPENDLSDEGYSEGSFKLIYNFLRKITDRELFVKSISSNRDEIILSSNTLDNTEIENIFKKLKSNFEDYNFVKNYLINFGKNELYLITNIALDVTSDIYNIFIKLYNPLSANISTKLLLNICEEIIQTYEIDVTLTPVKNVENKLFIKSANFNIDLDEQSSVSTDYYDTTSLMTSIGAKDSINTLLKKTSSQLNINYEDFSQFCHYGNVEQRILNFVYKLKQIELYSSQLNNNLSNSIIIHDKILKIVSNLDDYEYFLYTSNSEKSYPKNNDGTVKSTLSNDAIIWLGDSSKDTDNSGMLGEAKTFDNLNKNSLINNIPQYLSIDDRNRPFIIFCNMIGQHFDSIWIATNKFSEIYESNNNLLTGISPDIVENVLKSFGVKLYNSMSNVDITNSTHKNYNKEIYKRIFHNLPFLKKYKGTRNGLRQLINIFGIPDTLYKIYEYGSIKKDANSVEHIDNIFNYALASNRQGYIDIPFKTIDDLILPQSLLFRLKINSKTVNNSVLTGDFNGSDYNINDFQTSNTVINYSDILFKIILNNDDYLTIIADTYDNNISSIYIKAINGSVSNRVTLNLDKDVWTNFYLSRIVDRGDNITTYKLIFGQIINGKIVKKSILFEIYDEFSSSVNINAPNMNIRIGENLDYSIQKLLIFGNILDDDKFDIHIYNSTSITENSPFIDSLLCYIPFGIDLKTYNHRIVTELFSKIYSSNYTEHITLSGFDDENNYETNYENIRYISPNTLSTKRLTNKISVVNKSYYGNILSAFKHIDQTTDEFIDYKFLDVVFSPTFEQDNDIINRIGDFNLDDYIGEPTDTDYSDLKILKKIYLSKLVDKYNIKDYINIINYIDNSLFKMIKDFVPISNNLSTGIMIRQNILNRNKIKNISTVFEQFLIDDITLSNTNIDGKFLNIEKDFDIYLKGSFDTRNYNKFLIPLNKNDKNEFNKSLFNQNGINFLDSTFQFYSTTDVKNKYDGVKVFNYKLNQYIDGDVSLGKTLNLSSYVEKIGLFTNISNSDIFDKKSNIQLKYLVDKNGGLTDLNKLNKNIYDIQELFKKDGTTIVNLFDNIKYSNQKSLDGDKKIFSSGFSYSPVLYFSNKDKYFKFDNLEESVPTYFRYFENKNRDITNIKNVFDLFQIKDIDVNDKFVVGNGVDKIYSTYTIPESGQYEFNLDVLLNIKSTNPALTFKYTLTTYRNYISNENIIDSISYIHRPTDVQYDIDGNPIVITELKPVYKILEIPILGTDSMTNFNSYWSNEKNSYNLNGAVIPFDVNRTWKLFEKGVTNTSESYQIYISEDSFKYKTPPLYEIFDSNGNLEKLRDVYFDEYEETVSLNIPVSDMIYALSKLTTNLSNDFAQLKGIGVLVKNIDIIKNGVNNSYNKGEQILCVLQQIYTNDATPNTITLQRSSSIYSVKNNFNLKLGSNESLISSLSTSNIVISSKINDYIGKGMFNMSGSDLYPKYGEINNIFDIQNGDIIFLKDGKTNSSYFAEILSTKIVGKNLIISLLNELPSFLLKDNLSECIFINKISDETNVVINFNKKNGETSYGFLIPSNINPLFMNNIDIITKEVKQKLLNDYSLNKNSI